MFTAPAVRITGRGQQLLDALRTHGGWARRADLAQRTGKNRLSPHDIELLSRLVTAGRVEVRERPSYGPMGIAYEYRAV